ncbi:quinone-dependent dihydroorotate dehydrogenase [Stenotrophobium rhamnosiphilum]|uniref:Dihydroorotate dehydrogenase (quinone) n=1 Tax=Stenotrophobium rhamnosiphilum TaxID=2029166 RepID=A0A2T5MEZ4_9GAMM|nr:quinone-dependent dihydroorotate dehydrogenase [Stenotrophobium rhamnosiphilum]PTU31143.1 quinone-dependent dihydroorotate dehydrogenase [Stenotrophobium rhamnosiphilum]
MLYNLARSALFRLDAEHAHELTLATFKNFPRLATAPFACQTSAKPVELMGLKFPNRVGLAAGLDKNGECIEAWARLGFGFIEVGTVTPRAQPGNPKPRMFRLPQHQAIINRLGFNNKGVDYLLAQIERTDYKGILGINIGKNFDTPIENAADDYLICLRKAHAAASYITVNISSPNTKNLRDLQDEERLNDLLRQIRDERVKLAQEQGVRKPLLVKIAPDISGTQIEHIAQAAKQFDIDGLIATNTTVTRPQLGDEILAKEQGGLSGAPLRELANETLRKLRTAVGPDFTLVGVGGIVSGDDALAKRQAGADLVQVYTGFIYQGPSLIGDCAKKV